MESPPTIRARDAAPTVAKTTAGKRRLRRFVQNFLKPMRPSTATARIRSEVMRKPDKTKKMSTPTNPARASLVSGGSKGLKAPRGHGSHQSQRFGGFDDEVL